MIILQGSGIGSDEVGSSERGVERDKLGVVTCILVGLALVGKWLDKFIEALRNQMKVDSFFFMWR